MSEYQARDFEQCDYDLYRLAGIPGILRGPKPAEMTHVGRMVSFLGAAQTFGAMCPYPFPTLLGSMVGRVVLNFGIGGSGPKRFLGPSHAGILHWVNQSQVCVVQVMSGRSEENRLMVNPTGGQELRWRSDPPETPLRPAGHLYREMLQRHARETVLQVIDDTRRNWIDNYRSLAEKIRVPKILLWISTREPELRGTAQTVEGIFGDFPQMVNAEMLASIAGCFDEVAMAISTEGVPAPFWSRFTGLPIKIKVNGSWSSANSYYPSQQLHVRAAQSLEPLVRKFL